MPRTATHRQIRSAYVERARHAHPDLVGGRGLDMMRALNEAWETLKDQGRRRAWDAATAPAQPQAAAPNGSASGARSRSREDAARPFWFGAHGPPPGRPFGPVVSFGIFEGWSIGEIARRDRGYLVWLQDRPEADAIRADIAKLLHPSPPDAVETRGRRRR